jgi:heptosyltransferase-2
MKIAVFLPNWVGDVVMATPALRALRAHFPSARVLGILKPYVADVLDGAPWIDEQIHLTADGPWRQRWPFVAARLRRERIDLALLFPNSFRSALVAWLGSCGRRVGYARQGRTPLLTDRLQSPRDAAGRFTASPILDAYNRVVERVGVPRPSRRLELFTTPRDEAEADKVWAEARFQEYPEVICLNPGAAFGSAKYWSLEYFATLARALVDQRGSGVLVLCGPKEQELAEHIQELAARPAVHTLAAHPLSLGLTKACVRRCDLLVTTDSGPRHFAAAFDRPVITLFGPTHIAWTETYHPKAIHLQKQVDCGPCQLRICPLDHRCMRQLEPAEVFAAAEALLRRFPPAHASPQRKAS